jgi:transcriptional regulator with XRE-family HTH domain
VNTSEENKFLIAFGKNLRLIRKTKGFTQQNLANDLGIEISQISRIERGIINTSVLNTYKIAKALNIEVKDLFNFK